MKTTHPSFRRALVVFFTFAMIAAACSGSTTFDSDFQADGGTDTDGGSGGDDGSDLTVGGDDGEDPTPAPTADTSEAEAIAAAWLNSDAAMGDRMMSELQQSDVVAAGPVTHVTFDQIIDEQPM